MELPPAKVRSAPEIVVAEMLTVSAPVFVRLSLCVALLPTGTSPKLMVAGFAERVPGTPIEGFAALVTPAQPERPRIAGNPTRISRKTNALRTTRNLAPQRRYTRRMFVNSHLFPEGLEQHEQRN